MPTKTAYELRTEGEQLEARMKAISVEANGDPFTGEQRTELDQLRNRGMDIRTELAAINEDDERRRDIDKMSDFMNLPKYRVPLGVGNGPEDSRKALLSAGWEIHNGIMMAPTSLGKLQAMWHVDVLDGPIPEIRADDPGAASAAAYYRQVRAAFQPGYREAYCRYLALAGQTRSEGVAFSRLTRTEQDALSEGLDTAGGNLVPVEAMAEMLVRLAQRAVIRRYANVQPTSRDMLKWPMVRAHPTSGSIYSSAFVGGWVGETPAFSDTDPVFDTFEIPVKKLRVATKLSNDFISDSVVNVLAFLARNGAENMALVEDNGFIAGDGSALQPLGILNGGSSTVDISGSTADTISNTTSDAGSAPKLIDLVYALPSQYLQDARWIMRRAIEGDIRKLVDGQGRYHWPASGFGGTPRSLLDYPVENSEFVPNDGTDTNKVAIFGDIGAYVIADRAQVTSVILRERFADTDQVGIILFERVGGALWNTDALRLGVV